MLGSVGVGTGPGVSSGRSFLRPATTRGAGECSPTSIASPQHCTQRHYTSHHHKIQNKLSTKLQNNWQVRLNIERVRYTRAVHILFLYGASAHCEFMIPTGRPAGASLNEWAWFACLRPTASLLRDVVSNKNTIELSLCMRLHCHLLANRFCKQFSLSYKTNIII